MPRPLDIYRFDKNGNVVWIGTAENLEVAKLSVKVLARSAPGDYLIFSPATGDKVVVKLEECA
jgi:hypothetical protein